MHICCLERCLEHNSADNACSVELPVIAIAGAACTAESVSGWGVFSSGLDMCAGPAASSLVIAEDLTKAFLPPPFFPMVLSSNGPSHMLMMVVIWPGSLAIRGVINAFGSLRRLSWTPRVRPCNISAAMAHYEGLKSVSEQG